jgi:hypothetical protein
VIEPKASPNQDAVDRGNHSAHDVEMKTSPLCEPSTRFASLECAEALDGRARSGCISTYADS